MFPQRHSDSDSFAVRFDKHTIETPEQLRLDFQVAGIGSRFLALAIDTLIQGTVGITVLVGGSGLIRLASASGDDGVWILAGLGVFFFLLFFGYFMFFEIIWQGQTPGKRVIGIRVVKDSGRPLTAAESIGRNLMRIVDQLPGFYAIGIVAALLNSRNKRLGDLVSGTVVVRESSLDAIKPIWQAAQSGTGYRMLAASALSVEDLTLIDAFLNRRGDLAPDVRSRMAAQILGQLRARLPLPENSGLSNEAILESLAYERRSAGGN